jgi:hypothetical protein
VFHTGTGKRNILQINTASPHIITGTDHHEEEHQDKPHDEYRDEDSNNEHKDEESDEHDEDYNDDSDSEDEDEDTRTREFFPELEKALAEALNMRLRKHELHERLRKSHYLDWEGSLNGDSSTVSRNYVCTVALPISSFRTSDIFAWRNGQDTKLDGWTHGPRYLVLHMSFPARNIFIAPS